MSAAWPPKGWPTVDGEPLTYGRLVDILERRNRWAAQVHELGIDAPVIPTTFEEEEALRVFKARFEELLLDGDFDAVSHFLDQR